MPSYVIGYGLVLMVFSEQAQFCEDEYNGLPGYTLIVTRLNHAFVVRCGPYTNSAVHARRGKPMAIRCKS